MYLFVLQIEVPNVGLKTFTEAMDAFRTAIAILSRLRQNFILKRFWEIEYLTIRKKLK